jgi:putative ribosome biogenesis GTPase RsgA
MEGLEKGELSKERHESYVKIYEEIKTLRPFQSTKNK